MKITFTIFFTLFQITNVFCQNCFPLRTGNPSWNVFCQYFNWGVTQTENYEYDTLFCGYSYSKIGNGYVRSDSLRTYVRVDLNCDSSEFIMYDYSLSIGDTVSCGYNLLSGTGVTTKFMLNSVDTVNYIGTKRRRFEMYWNRNNFGALSDIMYWVYGIGALQHPFHSLRTMADFAEVSYSLLCYDSSGILQYVSPLNTCDSSYNLSVNEFQDIYEYNLYPNPIIEILNIFSSMNTYEVEIYTLQGKKVFLAKIKNNIGREISFDLNNKIGSGEYLLIFKSDNILITKKIIKI